MIVGCMTIVGLTLFASFQRWGVSIEAKALTAEEAIKKAVEKYNGEIIDTTKEDDEYH